MSISRISMLLVLLCPWALLGQTIDGPSSPAGAGSRHSSVAAAAGYRQEIRGETTGSDADAEASARWLVQFLRDHPGIESDVRTSLSETTFATGEASPVPSEEEFYERLQADPRLQAAVFEWLSEHGYLNGAASEETAGAGLKLRAANETRRETGPGRRSPQPEAQDGYLRKRNPYPDLPSLRDLYGQVSAQEAPLRRFGLDAFRAGRIRNDNFDLPAGADYVLGPGDGLSINLWGSVSQRIVRTVDREGRIALPESGAVTVAGLTLAQATQLVEKALQAQFRDVKADVSLTRLRSVRVYVVGDVERPGAYDVSSLSTVMNAVDLAGGPTERGSLRRIEQYRGRELVRRIDLYDLLLRGVRSDLERLQAGDTILVPPVGPQVAIAGMVRRPAIYELKDERNLSQVVEMAGGLLVSATLQQVTVERIVAHAERITVSLQVPPPADARVIEQALGSFGVQDGDRVRIAPILPYSLETVYLEGHVTRPGKYPHHPGMQIGELLKSYEDVLPEPASHAEIVRLMPPDYHPVTLDFDLNEVLTEVDPIELRPFDTVRIFGRYDIDAPKVTIVGEALRPGQYPLSRGMKVTDLLRQAGGFKRSAYREEAELGSYEVINDKKVLLERHPVAIAKALAGDGAADVLLKPGDELMIRTILLKGDMALVGPRPETPQRVRNYSEWQRQRLRVRPGMTGLAQVHGLRDRHSSEAKARFDMQYILQWSPWLDVALVLQTAWTVLARLARGAARASQAGPEFFPSVSVPVAEVSGADRSQSGSH